VKNDDGTPRTLLQDCWLDGERVDVLVEGGRIAAIGAIEGPATRSGGTICPPFAEPHVHLDATLLAREAPNLSGTLEEGIANWARLRDGLGKDDVKRRARETLGWYRDHGCFRVRTHVDTGCLQNVEALVELRDEVAERGTTLQIVAFPQEGILTGQGREALWREAVAMGCDAVGAIPHFEPTRAEGDRSLRLAMELAAREGVALDVHCDERDSGDFRHIRTLCALASEHPEVNVVAGHCTAMHAYPADIAEEVIEEVVQSGVQIVTNPLDNIVLQGRGSYPRMRGHTRVDELWAAGACVGIGHDSVMDPWYGLGTANLLDAAYVLVHYAHLTAREQLERCFTALSDENHRPFGSRPSIQVGAATDFLFFDARDPVEVLRLRPKPLIVRPSDDPAASS